MPYENFAVYSAIISTIPAVVLAGATENKGVGMGSIAKMICVDDNLFVLHMIESFMEGYFQVTLAGSAEEGLDMLELHGPFDIVLSDYDMPA